MLNAGEIADMVIDMGFQSPRIAGKDGWSGQRIYILSFGPPAYRQTLLIEPEWDMSAVRAKLEATRAPSSAEAVMPALEVKTSPAVTPAPAKGKRKKVGTDGH